MPGDSRRTHRKRPGQLPNRGRTLGQSAENGAPRAVGKGKKHLVEIAVCLLHRYSIVNGSVNYRKLYLSLQGFFNNRTIRYDSRQSDRRK